MRKRPAGAAQHLDRCVEAPPRPLGLPACGAAWAARRARVERRPAPCSASIEQNVRASRGGRETRRKLDSETYKLAPGLEMFEILLG